MRHAWTDLDRQTLRHLRLECGFTWRMVSMAMGLSMQTIQSQAYLEGLTNGKSYSDNPWLPCEDDYLRQTDGKLSRKEQAKALGRAPNAITNRLRRLRRIEANTNVAVYAGSAA